MKVLRVIASIAPSSGGPCQGIRNSIPALKKLGVHNEVVCMDDPKAGFLGNDTFPVYALGPTHNPWAYSSQLKPWLRENLGRFDAVIVHGLWLYPGHAVNQAFKQIKGKHPKLFVMPHGMLDPYFQRAPSRMLKALRNWFYWKLIETKLIHRADGLLFTCEQELVLARDTFRPYMPAKELNVGYGIPEAPPFIPEMSVKFKELCTQIAGKKYLLFLSRIHEKKGVDLLIKAYAKFKEHDLNDELPLLVIAGPGMETAYGRQLQGIVDENPFLKSSIFFPGMLSGPAKWGAFYGCEAFILPSHQENFGIAIVEAMACGEPVLISNKVNIWREISAEGAGIILGDTTEEVKNTLEAWSSLTKEAKLQMGLQALSCFRKNFAISSASKRFIDAIS